MSTGKKILVVDDEKEQRDILKRVFKKLGYNAKIAANSEAALEALKKEDFPLIITDLNMPDNDGTELCKQIRTLKSKAVIYALSGYISSYDTDKLEYIGFDGYIAKPASFKILKQAVEGAFDRINRLSAAEESFSIH